MAPSSAGPERSSPQYDIVPEPIRSNSSSTRWWNGVPRGTMDEVSSHGRLALPTAIGKVAQKIVPPRLRIPRWTGLCADSGEKHEPASDIDTPSRGQPKALDPKRPIREADITAAQTNVRFVPK